MYIKIYIYIHICTNIINLFIYNYNIFIVLTFNQAGMRKLFSVHKISELLWNSYEKSFANNSITSDCNYPDNVKTWLQPYVRVQILHGLALNIPAALA